MRLREAYDAGLLTKDDLKEMAVYYNSGIVAGLVL